MVKYIVWDAEITERLGGGDERWGKPWVLTISVVCTIDHKGERRHYFGNPEEIGKLVSVFMGYDAVVGFNTSRFDSLLIDGCLGLSPNSTNSILRGSQVDILSHVHHQLGHRVKLQQIAEGLGLSKSGDGGEAPELWAQGKIDEVIQYCYGDVEITKAIYEYGVRHGRVPYRYHGETRWIPVETWMPALHGQIKRNLRIA